MHAAVLLAAMAVGQFGGIAPVQGIRDADGTQHYAIMSLGSPIPSQLHANPFVTPGAMLAGAPSMSPWDGRSSQIVGYVGGGGLPPIFIPNAMSKPPKSRNALVYKGSTKFLGIGVVR